MEVCHKTPRNSSMLLGNVYFWTDTIKDWKHLLRKEEYKMLIIEQLQWLKHRNKIKVYAYVLMPNHIHIIWELLKMNGKEMPHASFNKWTSAQFLRDIKAHHASLLRFFKEETRERKHRFWQRDPLAIKMDSREIIEQKIDYIHLNPLQERWNLALRPEEYRWSSALFYDTGYDEFGILTHYMEKY